ncbi:MAG TPA: hypothetical protein PKB13_10130 [Clostridia bacterium]|nr:hypothetical protein [Clostridia bacterium]
MDITVKVSDLLSKAKELHDSGMDYVTLSILDEDKLPSGEILPRCLHFSAFSEAEKYMEIDYEEIDEASVARDEQPFITTNIR